VVKRLVAIFELFPVFGRPGVGFNLDIEWRSIDGRWALTFTLRWCRKALALS
jgi:hypothetical protein